MAPAKKQKHATSSRLQLVDRPATIECDIEPSPICECFEQARTAENGIQAGVLLEHKSVSTQMKTFESRGMMHTEGGWPAEVDTTSKEQKERYRKRVERDEDFNSTLVALADRLEPCIMENLTIDIYKNHLAHDETTHHIVSDPPSAKAIAIFKDCDLGTHSRSPLALSWSPDNDSTLAVAYGSYEFKASREQTHGPSFIWSLMNTRAPLQQLSLRSGSFSSLVYNPKDSHLVAAGSSKGLVGLWDTRQGSDATSISPIDSSHRDHVTGICWLANKSALECCSISPDGQLLFWDLRQLTVPVDSLNLCVDGTNQGGTTMSFPLGASKLLCGTENGEIMTINRKAKKSGDQISGTTTHAHYGPVRAIARSPFFAKYYLTCGDWTYRMWSDEVHGPIIASQPTMTSVLDAVWSATRPGVFFTSTDAGHVHVWDCTTDSTTPQISTRVSEAGGINCLAIKDDGRLLACTGLDGTVTLLELSPTLVEPCANERQIVVEVFEKEARRQKCIDLRQKDIARSIARADKHDVKNAMQDVNEEEIQRQVEADLYAGTTPR